MVARPPSAFAAPLPSVDPAKVGISPERLEILHALIQGKVDRGELAGAVTLIARDGRIADVRAYGWENLETKSPMRRDALFRIASMTKIVTAVAVLTLREQGRLGLDDPIGNYLPELRAMRVAVGGDAVRLELAPARPITIRHLLTHTSGLAAGGPQAAKLQPLYDAAENRVSPSLEARMAGLAQLPLCNQPGDAMYYGASYEVLGRLVEVVSGRPFDRYVRDHLFGPLAMNDSFFQIPPEKQARLARTYVRGPEGRLRRREAPGIPYHLGGVGYPRGGGGLVTTADDFARFGQMLLNGGELDGVRILDPKTVELMTKDHLTELKVKNTFLQPFESYGFGVSVRLTLGLGPTLGSVGQFGWTGAWTTYCSMDPRENTVALLMTQHGPWNDDDIFSQFSVAFYQTLADRRTPPCV